MSKEVEETKRSSEKLIDTLKAVLEETDVRIAELKKDAYEFKRDIVVGAENFRTGKTMAVRDFSLSFSSLLFPPFHFVPMVSSNFQPNTTFLFWFTRMYCAASLSW